MAWFFLLQNRLQQAVHFTYNQLLPLLLLIGAILGLWWGARLLEPAIFDRLVRLSALNIAQQSAVRLILINDASLQQLSPSYGPLPWSPQTYQALLSQLQGYEPLLLGLASPLDLKASPAVERPSSDPSKPPPPALAPLVLGLPQKASSLQQQTVLHAQDSPLKGHLAISTLSPLLNDGVQRSIQPYSVVSPFSRYGGIYPAFSVAVVLDALNQRSIQSGQASHWSLSQSLDPQAEGLHFQQSSALGSLLPLGPTSKQQAAKGEPTADGPLKEQPPQQAPPQQAPHRLTVPLSLQGRFMLRPYQAVSRTPVDGALYSHKAYPLHEVLSAKGPEAQALKADLKGKILLLGTASALYKDYYPSSLGARHLGVDLHATAIDNLLFQHTLKRSPDWQRAGWILLSFFGVLLLRVRLLSFGRTLLYTFALMVLYFWYAFTTLLWQHTVVDVLTPEVFMVLGLAVGTLWWASQRDRQYHSLEKTLSQLVAPSVLREIQSQKQALQPGGQRLQITSLFVDIRDFTRLVENLPALEVTDLLNAFYAEVEQCVFAYKGTVDKYMGDGVLVLFGAPLPMADHADRGLLAAEALTQQLQALAQQWWAQRQLHFEVGISVNSGYAYVGFLGPASKLEYTAVGDTVNLCVRLQEQNKRLKTSVVLSEHTVNLLQDVTLKRKVASQGQVQVRGREAQLEVFELMTERTD